MGKAWRRFGVIAAAGLAALAAAVAPQARALADGTAVAPPAWHVASVFAGQPYANLIPLTAISASDAWTFGDGAHGREVALHWNGSKWTPTYPFGTLPRPWFVSATGSGNVWVTPQGCTSNGNGYLARYNGSKWAISTFPGKGGTLCQAPVVTTGAANGWIFGRTDGTTNATKALHFTGGKLVPVTIGNFGAAIAVSAVSASNIHLLTDTNAGKMLVVHYDGKSWRAVSLPAAPAIPRGERPLGVAITAVTSSNIWIAAELIGNGDADAALLLHYDGTKWRWMKDPYTDESVQTIAYDAGGVWLSAIGAPDSANGWDFQHWNGTRWSRVPAPAQGVPGTGVSYELYNLVHIPRTHSFWAGGDAFYATTSGGITSTAQAAVVLKFGP